MRRYLVEDAKPKRSTNIRNVRKPGERRRVGLDNKPLSIKSEKM